MPPEDQRLLRRESPDASLRWYDGDKRARFERNLSRLLPVRDRIGVAVSGGPDSLALLLLANAARPGLVEAATVDHGLRPESVQEAANVAEVCAGLDIPHTILRVQVAPGASLQAQARRARYAALAEWAEACGLSAVLTAHQADDQAETLLMRLARGAGLAGLAGVRPVRPLVSGSQVRLVRPLLTWRKDELVEIVQAAGVISVEDPSNSDPRHDRTRARSFLAAQDWLEPSRLAATASHLAEAEEALAFAAGQLFTERHREEGGVSHLTAADLPRELQRRLLLLALAKLGVQSPRGPDIERALTTLLEGGTCTLGGVKLEGSDPWLLSRAAPRR